MPNILDKINTPEDLRKLTIREKETLAIEIRRFLLETVSKTGGHLASNLGVVELTIAIHSIFNTPEDKLIWDVGHQCYVHKILTGRKDKMDTLRKLDGLSGFPKLSESEYDTFETGHSSTSISAALGMARARDILKKDNQVIAVIGDGALTGGMAEEAMNDAGSSNSNIIVILNDNEMSISKNVGGISMFLSKLRSKRFYKNSNKTIREITSKIPYVGNKIIKLTRRVKDMLKQLLLPNMYFEDIGFTYLGPVDGHNIEQLESLLKKAKEHQGPVLVHVITKKGKGYTIAEESPSKFHGISSFDIKTGEKLKKSSKDYSKVFGETLVELAEKDEKIVAITAAMKDGTGLTKFAEKYPNRFFDVGIAEQHALCMTAGMAVAGLKPVIALYSSFVQRGFDQVIHDICMQELPVVIGIDRAGIVGNDGETHQGIFDLSFLSIVPNLAIMAPKDFEEFTQMIKFAVNYTKPIAVRYPRGGESEYKFEKCEPIELGKAEVIKEGEDITIIAIGKMVSRAMEAVQELQKSQNPQNSQNESMNTDINTYMDENENKDIDIEVINARFLTPLDKETLLKSINKTKRVITIEDNIEEGGLGTKIEELIVQEKLEGINLVKVAYPIEFVKQGGVQEIEIKYGLDAKSIAKKIEMLYNTYEYDLVNNV